MVIILNFIFKVLIMLVLFVSFFILGGLNFIYLNESSFQKEIIALNLSEESKTLIDPIIINSLVLLNSFKHDLIIDLRYASKNNFTGTVLYDADVCLLRYETLVKLLNAQKEFKSLGYNIKIWDAYRPFYIQRTLWDVVPNNNYIANPYKGGSNHNRACAVDITLTDLDGNEIDMPTGFDEFSPFAHRSYIGATETQIKNAELLKEVMLKHGFKSIYTEWWHFDDVNNFNYPIINIGLNEYLQIIKERG